MKIKTKTCITGCIPVQWTGISLYWLQYFHVSITRFSYFGYNFSMLNLQGLPCWDYNYSLSNLQGNPCLYYKFSLVNLQVFLYFSYLLSLYWVTITCFYCSHNRVFPVIIKKNISIITGVSLFLLLFCAALYVGHLEHLLHFQTPDITGFSL